VRRGDGDHVESKTVYDTRDKAAMGGIWSVRKHHKQSGKERRSVSLSSSL
jgi:hypothetical protein